MPVRLRRPLGAVLAGLTGAAALALAPSVAALAPGQGYDVSWPQCGRALPDDGDFRIVGVNGGKPYTDNDCLADQFRWAKLVGDAAFYINTANPGPSSAVVDWYSQKSPSPSCGPADEAACAYNYGYNGARLAWDYAQRQTGAAARHSWWLDVETANSWSSNRALNVADIVGAITFLRTKGVHVGVYSTGYQWGRIAAGAHMPDVLNWIAGARNAAEAASWCRADSSFTGGPVVLIQWEQDGLDHNHACVPLPPTPAPVAAPANPNVLKILLERLLGIDLP